MLKVSFNLARVAALLFGSVQLGCLIEVDSLNSPTAEPIPSGAADMVTSERRYKRLMKV